MAGRMKRLLCSLSSDPSPHTGSICNPSTEQEENRQSFCWGFAVSSLAKMASSMFSDSLVSHTQIKSGGYYTSLASTQEAEELCEFQPEIYSKTCLRNKTDRQNDGGKRLRKACSVTNLTLPTT